MRLEFNTVTSELGFATDPFALLVFILLQPNANTVLKIQISSKTCLTHLSILLVHIYCYFIHRVPQYGRNGAPSPVSVLGSCIVKPPPIFIGVRPATAPLSPCF